MTELTNVKLKLAKQMYVLYWRTFFIWQSRTCLIKGSQDKIKRLYSDDIRNKSSMQKVNVFSTGDLSPSLYYVITRCKRRHALKVFSHLLDQVDAMHISQRRGEI